MTNPRATNEDLTAKARIRNAALDLYAQYGEDRISLRDIASAAGVTLGLVQHHFKTKAGVRDAVDQLVVDYFAHALAQVPAEGSARHVAAARDEAVARMLRDNPGGQLRAARGARSLRGSAAPARCAHRADSPRDHGPAGFGSGIHQTP